MSKGSRRAVNAALAQGHIVRRPPARVAPRPTDIASRSEEAQIDVSSIAAIETAIFIAPSAPLDAPTSAPAVTEVTTPDRVPSAHPKVRRPLTRSHAKGRKVLAAFLGMALVGGGAYATTNWVIGLAASSSGEGQAASVQNLTIAAVATPAPANELYPGGTGDVVLTITNPNPYPVTITGVDLPNNTTYATGYTTSALTTTQTGCLSTTPSDVIWNYSTASSGSAHSLTTALTVGPNGNANDPLTVTLTNDASMTAAAPAACESTYFSMPALTGIAATGGAGTVTTTPATDAWTS